MYGTENFGILAMDLLSAYLSVGRTLLIHTPALQSNDVAVLIVNDPPLEDMWPSLESETERTTRNRGRKHSTKTP